MTKSIAVRLAPTTPRPGEKQAFGDPTELPLDKVAKRIANRQAEPYLPIQEHLPMVPADGLNLAEAFTEYVCRHPDIVPYGATRSAPSRVHTRFYIEPPSWEAVAKAHGLRRKAGLDPPRSPIRSTWVGSAPVQSRASGVVVFHGELVQATEEAIGDFVWDQITHGFFAKLAAGDLFAVGVAEVDLYTMEMTPIAPRWWSRDIVVRLSAGEIWESNRQRHWSEIIVKPAPHAESDADAPARSGAPGRPTSMHLVEDEFHRRAAQGLTEPTLREESAALAEWLEKTHPRAPRLKPKTIENRLRGPYRVLRPKTDAS